MTRSLTIAMSIAVALSVAGCASEPRTGNDVFYGLAPDHCDKDYCNVGKKPDWQYPSVDTVWRK